MEYYYFFFFWQLALSICLFIIFVCTFFTFSAKWNNLPPSPLSLPIIGHLYLYKKPLHRALARLSTRYGPIVFLRFGSRPVLVISSAALAEECFTKNDVALAGRPQLATVKHLTYNYTTVSAATYGPHWRNIRRITTVEVLSAHRLNLFTRSRDHEARGFARRLFHEYSVVTGSSGGFARTEIKPRLFGLSLNVMMMMLSGKSFYGDEVIDCEEAQLFREIIDDFLSLSGASNLQDFLPAMLRWVGMEELMKKVRRLVEQRNIFLQGFIDEHRRVESEANDKKRTMISELLSQQKLDPDYYTDEIIKSLIYSMLLAGTDTSATTVEWAMSLLLNNPKTMEKARAEIDTRIEKGRLLQESDLANLPYLGCIIKETLRMHPAAPLLLPHESIEDCVIRGFNIPRGTMVLCNAYAIHRDPETWVDPHMFMPERFEGEEGEERDRLIIPFGIGRRRCPGEGLARRVMGLELGVLIQCFEWEKIGPEQVDMSEGSGLTLPKAVPLEILYKPIHTMINVLSALSTISA